MGSDHYIRGVQAYKSKDYKGAIEILFNAPLDQWDAQLYLGMSYYMTGKHTKAREHFARIRDLCPDDEIREKATAAFAAVNAKLLESAKLDQAEEDGWTIS